MSLRVRIFNVPRFGQKYEKKMPTEKVGKLN